MQPKVSFTILVSLVRFISMKLFYSKMSHEIVLKLSKEIELVLPQLFAATIARKAIFVFVYAVISVCSPLIKSKHFVLFND